jgi:hypothetical protein
LKLIRHLWTEEKNKAEIPNLSAKTEHRSIVTTEKMYSSSTVVTMLGGSQENFIIGYDMHGICAGF